jgi:hypothetical protein
LAEAGFEAARVAGDLLRQPIDAVEAIAGSGRNSRVYRVHAGERSFCLKHYVASGADPRNRLGTEMDALELMTRHGIVQVPKPVARDAAQGCALMSWIEGVRVDAPDGPDIDAAAQFLSAVQELSRLEEAKRQPLGSEACLSGAEIVGQLERRSRRLEARQHDEPGLAEFFPRYSRFLAEAVLPYAIEGYRARGWRFDAPLAMSSRSLCPSDFGFHNALRSADGLVFLDFDYFGWDDPVKLVADFVLHPGMDLSDASRRRFVGAARRIYGADGTFAPRLNLLFALFALRWCLILLNEFLPERWATRLHAGLQDEWTSVKRRQLERAQELLALTETTFPRFPYDL